ncbi:MAG: HTH domain-containing protein [Pseudomonadota bacterium]
MAAGVAISNEIQPNVMMEKKQFVDLDETLIQEALLALTQRQRQIAQWILAQPEPVSFTTIAKHFGIHHQTVRELLSNSIKRIERYGHQRIRGKLTVAT